MQRKPIGQNSHPEVSVPAFLVPEMFGETMWTLVDSTFFPLRSSSFLGPRMEAEEGGEFPSGKQRGDISWENWSESYPRKWAQWLGP